MKIGIVCSNDRELNPFLQSMDSYKTFNKAMLIFYEGHINEVAVVALFSGAGKTNAAIATQILIDTFQVDIVVNSGTAGGIDGRLNIFDTVIATEVAHHDVHEVILSQFHPWMKSRFFKTDEMLLKLSKIATKRLAPKHKIHYGRMVTGEKFITTTGRDKIISEFAPFSVDMETASISHACYVNDIPFISVRTITDTSEHCGPEYYEKNCAFASEISKDIVLELLTEILNSSTE
jgi:adenosylhomocysteine nucleosidase